MNKKIYFAGSIRGGREDEGLYQRLIGWMAQTDRVLTEHVGDLRLSPLEKAGDGAIFRQDVQWIRECDVLIAECSRPSLGVGYELGYAEGLKKPCHVLYRPSVSSLSAMIAGNPYFRVHPYETEEEARAILSEILK